MSIKTIDKQMQGSAGIAKKINKGAEKMVFDILQSTQYSMPIQSTVRELVTNACDSQREKEVALEILNGKKKLKIIILNATVLNMKIVTLIKTITILDT